MSDATDPTHINQGVTTMKRTIAFILGAVLLVGALENPAHSADQDQCAKLGQLAEMIMTVRYSGTPLSAAMALLADEQFKPFRPLVLLAYQSPDYASPEYQRREIVKFRNTTEIGCYRAEK